MPLLVIIEPGGGEQRFRLDQAEYVVGRDPSAEIPLSGAKVSRRHARIFRRQQGYWMEDLESANGVLIDGRPIEGACRMLPGLAIDVGDFTLSIDDGSTLETPAPALAGLTEPFLGRVLLLPAGDLPVGSSTDGAVILPHPSVSAEHATLSVAPNAIVVEDLDSEHGTWVNGTRVGRRAVEPGDRLRFGEVEFELLPPERWGLWARVTVAGARIGRGLARLDRRHRLLVRVGMPSLLLCGAFLLSALIRSAPAPELEGHRSAEEIYFAAIETDLAAGRAHMADQNWGVAERAFEAVLDRDPINREARRATAAAGANQLDKQALKAAEAQLKAGDADAALDALSPISPDAHYALAAGQLGARARELIADQTLGLARDACQKAEWRDCHAQAIRVLEHQPSSVPAQALLSESEDAMRARRIAFTPWAPPRAAGTAVSPTIESLYPDNEVRQAVMRYAAGDLETALKRALTFSNRAGGTALSEALTEFRSAWTAGNGAAVAGDAAQALDGWRRALAQDAAMLPDNQPSAFRDTLRRRVSGELLRLGNAAFGRGEYEDTFRFWSEARSHTPEEAEVLAALARLEERAQKMLRRATAANRPATAGCARLREIRGMTRPESQVHQTARQRQERHCAE